MTLQFRHCFFGSLGLGQAFAQWPGFPQQNLTLGQCEVELFAGLSAEGQTREGQNLIFGVSLFFFLSFFVPYPVCSKL